MGESYECRRIIRLYNVENDIYHAEYLADLAWIESVDSAYPVVVIWNEETRSPVEIYRGVFPTSNEVSRLIKENGGKRDEG